MTRLSPSKVDPISFLDEDEFEPEVGEFALSGYGTFGNFQLVGHVPVTNDMCGKYLHVKGCLRTDLHDGVVLDGVNYTGKIFARVIHYNCHKPSCSICSRGWAIREAEKIENRLAEASKRFGEAEHIVASVPTRDYGLDFEKLRSKVVDVLRVRGVIGGVLVFHGFRFREGRQWYWSPHFHALGYVKGGYKCRDCRRQFCSECSEFEGKTRREFERDGYIVKVLGKRLTVKGTAKYELGHATIRSNVKRPHASTWFGGCSYRKLKVKVEKVKPLCPICCEELRKICYTGFRHLVKDRDASGYVGSFIDELVEDGEVVWHLASDSYGGCR